MTGGAGGCLYDERPIGLGSGRALARLQGVVRRRTTCGNAVRITHDASPFPLDRGRGLAGDVVDDAIDAAHLAGDPEQNGVGADGAVRRVNRRRVDGGTQSRSSVTSRRRNRLFAFMRHFCHVYNWISSGLIPWLWAHSVEARKRWCDRTTCGHHFLRDTRAAKGNIRSQSVTTTRADRQITIPRRTAVIPKTRAISRPHAAPLQAVARRSSRVIWAQISLTCSD